MTVAASSESQAARLGREGVAQLMRLLEEDFGRATKAGDGVSVNQFLLEALDRGEHRSMTVYPAEAPIGVCYVGSGGLVVPAGLPDAAQPLAAAVRASGWRVLVGDLALGETIVEQAAAGLFRRRPYAREQRLMSVDAATVADVRCPGLRRALMDDLERLTDFACGLHVEDQMGPPLSRGGRAAVQQRVATSIRRDASWVIEFDGQVAAKIDVSIESRRRGAHVQGDARLRAGMPCVTLHVRADNAPAIRAYEAAGYVQRRRWLLALR
jgi:hypothetical protein